MTELDRRSFLKSGAAASAGAAVLGGPFAGFMAAPAAAQRRGPNDPPPALVDTPDQADGVVRLALPAGFQYRSFQPSSRTAPLILDDGSRLPGRHDGMAAFSAAPGNRHDFHHHDSILIRNHEENGAGVAQAWGGPGVPVYDTATRGGTSTVRVTGEGVVQESYGSICGTQMNCSGGEMPWGSWVTCEETVNGYDVGDDFTRTPPGGTDPGPFTYVTNVNLQKRHGYLFEVPVHGEASAEPITQAGRFAHESVAWDPHTEALYLSEDNFSFPSGFYKYVPPASPHKAGALVDGGSSTCSR